MKTCTKCKIEKPFTEFSKRMAKRDGLQSSCKACNAAHYADRRETIAAKRCLYRSANREKLAAYQSAYYAARPGKLSAQNAKYYAENPDKYAAKTRNRRARINNAEGKHTAADIRAIFEKQCGICANCQTKLFKLGANKYHVDHIMPLALGGSNWPSNLQCLCPTCNLKKHAKDPIDWAKENGRLI